VVRVGTTGGADERAVIGVGASRVIGARAGGTGALVRGPALELNRWYRLDLVYDVSDENKHTLDWQLDSVPQVQATYDAGDSTAVVTIGLGYEGTASSGACYFKYDLVSVTSPGSSGLEAAPLVEAAQTRNPSA
jgi:hypothetical protein